jgi:hypothetical protein
MQKPDESAFKPVDQEEKDLMESIERDERQPVKDIEQEKANAVTAALNTHRKV